MGDRPTPAELEDGIAQFGALLSSVHHKLLGFIAAYDEAEHWRGDGSRSMEDWLTCRQAIGRDTAGQWTTAAKALESLPAISNEFSAGRLAFDQVRPLCELATPETDESWARDACGATAAQLRRAARRQRIIQQGQAREELETRSLTFNHRRKTFCATLPTADFDLFVSAIDRLAGEGIEEPGTALKQPYAKRCADAIMELASTSIAKDADPDRATVVMFVDHDKLQSGEGFAHLESGEPVAASVAGRLMCDARLQIAVQSKDAKPLGIGRLSRTVPPWLRRLVKRRDAGCTFPDCERTWLLHAHHLIPWEMGGPTDLDNLVCLCGPHHRAVHEGGFRVRGSPESLEFFRPDGSPLVPRAEPVSPALRDRVMGLLWRPVPRLGFEES